VKATNILSALILYSTFAYGQLSTADTLARHNAIYLTKLAYQSAIAGNAQVFNGIEHIDPLQKKKLNGNPYFLSDEWQDGFVFYGDQLYERVYLLYNLFLDKLLIEHVQSHVTIELIPEKIKYFGISNHTFVWLSNSSAQTDIKDGFYEILYSGDTKVYARRYKTIKEVADQKVMVTEFLDKRKLYLFKDERYFTITNKGSALNAFGDDKAEIKKILSQKKLNFRADPEGALVVIANYYDELKK
jgi:hypothetical protein